MYAILSMLISGNLCGDDYDGNDDDDGNDDHDGNDEWQVWLAHSPRGQQASKGEA